MFIIYTDGACSGNPGPMGIGYVIHVSGKVEIKGSEAIGNGTNNIAEYSAVIKALEVAIKEYKPDKIELRADSQLIIRQLNGEYKVKDPKLKQLKAKIDALTNGISMKYVHIPREENKHADQLSKSAISS
ncbi:MAG: ribonuclease HI family protein [Candidatus Micrarchaeota archaeon]